MRRHRSKNYFTISLFVFGVFFGLCGNVYAISFDLDFFAPAQSFFGPNLPSASFSKSGGIGSSNLGASYAVSASTGTVQVLHNGLLNANYSSSTRTMDLNYVGDRFGGIISTAIGASAKVTLSLLGFDASPVNKGLSISSFNLFRPTLGTPIVTSGASQSVPFPVVHVGIASGDAVLGIGQTSTFKADSIEGLLNVQSASFPTQSLHIPFSLLPGSTTHLPLALPGGDWNVSVGKLDLNNSFNTKFRLDLGVGGRIFPGTFLEKSLGSVKVTGVPIFSSGTFGLAFNQLSTPSERLSVPFSSPEPATVLLLGSGLVGLVWWRRKQLRISSTQSPTV